MVSWSSISCPIVIRLPTVCYFYREKPLVKSTAPSLLFIIFAFAIYFYLLLFSDLSNQKYKIPCCIFYLFIFISCSREIYLSNLSYFYPVYLPIFGAVARKGLTTPLIRQVASICYLCAGAVYIVLHGSPTGSITLVSSLREIPTVVVLHHPFLFREIPTQFKQTSKMNF